VPVVVPPDVYFDMAKKIHGPFKFILKPWSTTYSSVSELPYQPPCTLPLITISDEIPVPSDILWLSIVGLPDFMFNLLHIRKILYRYDDVLEVHADITERL